MANKETDNALYEDILKANNAKEYDAAIAKIALLSGDYKADPAVKKTIASVYAGKCGLDFIEFVTDLGELGSTPLLKFLMEMWTDKVTSRTYCRLAQETMEEINPTYVGRSAGDSFFMIILGLAKMGTYLQELADINPTDGVVDNPPFDGTANSFCLSANLSNEDVAEIGSGLGLVIANLTNLGGTLSGVDLTDVSNTCNALTPNPCLIEDSNEYINGAQASALRLAVRTLLNTASLGFFDPGFPCVAE